MRRGAEKQISTHLVDCTNGPEVHVEVSFNSKRSAGVLVRLDLRPSIVRLTWRTEEGEADRRHPRQVGQELRRMQLSVLEMDEIAQRYLKSRKKTKRGR